MENMPTGWIETTLGEVCEIKYGKDHKKLDTGEIPLYGSGGVMRYVNQSIHTQESVLIPRKGTLSNLFYIKEPFWTVDTLFWTDINVNIINPAFLYYSLKCKNLLSLNVGTAVPSLTTEVLNNIIISLPPLAEQERIAKILSSLDDKIELNNKINKNLEEQAQAIYYNIFNDLDLPIVPISKIIDIRDGTHESPKFVEVGHPLVTSKNLLPFGIDIINTKKISINSFQKINERSKVDTGDILLSMIGTTGLVSLIIEKNIIFAIKNVGLFKTSKNTTLRYYIYAYLQSAVTQQLIDMKLAGSTQKYISLGELRKLPIKLPQTSFLEKYNIIVSPIYNLIIKNTIENQTLATLRDILLPKLMSGDIRV